MEIRGAVVLAVGMLSIAVSELMGSKAKYKNVCMKHSARRG